ncbi:four-carbon acid sugar kinase family protein [Streptomyces sp. 184]|uniref:four-carbon acid sugar kinase family protein n=1 Tax=Streptomyces sp. 184 TaxID=1827526 RepID=UPI0038914C3A
MTYEVAIVADDLTGAGDTAVQFARAGWPTLLRLGGDGPGAAGGSGGDARVVAVTTDSRARPDAQAAALVRHATTGLLRHGAGHLFKKVDSTLRGPVRAEIDAMLDVLPAGTVALVCPAFPAVGRTVVDGVLLVDGRPVDETAVGRDPVTPVAEGHLPTLLDAPLVRLDPQGTPAAWAAEVRAADSRVVVLDAARDEDLDRIARTVAHLGQRALAVGSAGLAGPLAAGWRPRRAQTPDPRPAPARHPGATPVGDPVTGDPVAGGPAGTALVVVTSLHDASRAQAGALAAHSAERLRPTGRDLTDDGAWAGFLDRVRTAAAGRPHTLLLTTPDRTTAAVDPGLVASRLAEAAAQAVAAGTVAGLVATGGDGARAVLERLGGTGIRLYETVEPGVPLGIVVGGSAAGLPVATKAGGFGSPDVLIKAAEAVRTQRSHR